MHVCVCVCMRVCMCVCMHVCVCACVRMTERELFHTPLVMQGSGEELPKNGDRWQQIRYAMCVRVHAHVNV